jgi:hypothetical protein
MSSAAPSTHGPSFAGFACLVGRKGERTYFANGSISNNDALNGLHASCFGGRQRSIAHKCSGCVPFSPFGISLVFYNNLRKIEEITVLEG